MKSSSCLDESMSTKPAGALLSESTYYKYLLVATCEINNFVLKTNQNKSSTSHSRSTDLQSCMHFGPPKLLAVDKNLAFTEVIQLILGTINCQVKITSQFHHGTLMTESQIKTIRKMVTKHLTGRR